MTHSLTTAAAIEKLQQLGMTDRELAAGTGVPVDTLRSWRKRGYPASFDASARRLRRRISSTGGGT